jgi:hypothetical protein
MSFKLFIQTQSYKRKSKNLERLGFDFNNQNIEEEYRKLQMLLSHEYLINCKSMPDLMKEYGIPSSKTLFDLFKVLNIEARSSSECVKLTVINGKWQAPPSYAYKHGWHTSWEGIPVYYRSSYELEYCKQLDEQKINYLMEPMRIQYYCTQSEGYRVAIPDFLLPQHHLIVEIKSKYWYNEIQMKDKAKVYKELGYNFKLILEGKEVPIR